MMGVGLIKISSSYKYYKNTSRKRVKTRDTNFRIFHLPDDAVVTGHAVIPLPKLPSSFDELSPEYDTPVPTYKPPSPILPKPAPVVENRQSSPMSTLERYRTRTRPSRIQTEYKDEEKFVLDRAQPEKLNKQVPIKFMKPL